ncbi:Vesicle-associated membrane protein 7 [Tritrichomonas foetus]|uniref:Vesicle-associated membrane protein 7 n=1 Tax=Tritrichomonas foetus TaxID=1144522 RepID=A0A1J4JIE0_9EUKA|nr:Vesicle-associated membrane protein 7 [Tritrichomonas foetus]|eukprot:OHS97293.1 Vesicle-associated membrane protein 7 [Tritrichomonas foetus]
MSEIVFCAVLRAKVIIASLGDQSAVSEKDVIKLLPVSSKTEQKITSGKLFTYMSTPGLTYVCVGPQSADKQRHLTFLDTLSRRWAATYGQISINANPHSLDSVLAQNFSSLFEEFRKPANKTAEVHRRLDETEAILNQSVSKALIRGGDLQAISAKSEDMVSASEEFRSQATNLKRRMRWGYIKSWAIYILFAIIVLYIILSSFCGGYRLQKCI